MSERQAQLLLTDASPLFSFAAIDQLDLMFGAGLPIVLTDYIEWEATRSSSVTAIRISDWLGRNKPFVSIVETETGQARIKKEKEGRADPRKNIGEQTIFEAISSEYIGEGPYVFLYEDEKAIAQVGPDFFGRYPVHRLTTYAYLVGLERSGVIPSADEVLDWIRGIGEPSYTFDLGVHPRPGLKKVAVDLPHRSRDGTDTKWRP